MAHKHHVVTKDPQKQTLTTKKYSRNWTLFNAGIEKWLNDACGCTCKVPEAKQSSEMSTLDSI